MRGKREEDSGRTGPALFAGTNNPSWVKLFFSADALLYNPSIVCFTITDFTYDINTGGEGQKNSRVCVNSLLGVGVGGILGLTIFLARRGLLSRALNQTFKI